MPEIIRNLLFQLMIYNYRHSSLCSRFYVKILYAFCWDLQLRKEDLVTIFGNDTNI